MARRFIVDNEDIKYFSKEECIIEIKGKEVKHIQVLRLDVNDTLVVNEYICKILKMHSNTIELEIVSDAKRKGEPNINLTLFIALLQGDKMDFVIQKAVELGVKNIVPFISSNTIVRLDVKCENKINRFSEFDVNIFAYENENSKSSFHDTIEYIKSKD